MGKKSPPSSCQIHRSLEKLFCFHEALRLQAHFSLTLFSLKMNVLAPSDAVGVREWAGGGCSVLPMLLKPQKSAIPHPRPHGRCIQHDPFPSKFAPFWGPRLLSARTKDARCRVSSDVGKNQGEIGVQRVFVPMGWGCTALPWPRWGC